MCPDRVAIATLNVRLELLAAVTLRLFLGAAWVNHVLPLAAGRPTASPCWCLTFGLGLILHLVVS